MPSLGTVLAGGNGMVLATWGLLPPNGLARGQPGGPHYPIETPAGFEMQQKLWCTPGLTV